jgi:DNA-binding transcriptional ArsR family regulator
MNERQAVDAFAALAQETRLRILRMLIKAGPDGMAAGAIAARLKVQPSNMSFHLAHLERAGLLESRRESRSIVYAAAYPALAEAIRFLMEDCCGGDPRMVAMCMPKMVRVPGVAERDAPKDKHVGASGHRGSRRFLK